MHRLVGQKVHFIRYRTAGAAFGALVTKIRFFLTLFQYHTTSSGSITYFRAQNSDNPDFSYLNCFVQQFVHLGLNNIQIYRLFHKVGDGQPGILHLL